MQTDMTVKYRNEKETRNTCKLQSTTFGTSSSQGMLCIMVHIEKSDLFPRIFQWPTPTLLELQSLAIVTVCHVPSGLVPSCTVQSGLVMLCLVILYYVMLGDRHTTYTVHADWDLVKCWPTPSKMLSANNPVGGTSVGFATNLCGSTQRVSESFYPIRN